MITRETKYQTSKNIIKQVKFQHRSHFPSISFRVSCNISKTSASVSSGVPNTEKLMKA